MSEVYLAGRGLACALGADLPAAMSTLRRGEIETLMVEIGGGNEYALQPYFAMRDQDHDWQTRARRIVCEVVNESGALATRTGPLFVASSSLDVGMFEGGGEFKRGLHQLGEEVAGWLEWGGPVFTVCSACTAATCAVISAASLIQAGEADDALVLGLELSNRLTIAGFAAMQLLAPVSAQPLGAQRSGIVLGEAVAALYLSRQPARWRIVGGANVVDGRNAAGASGSAVEAMCRKVLSVGGLKPADIDLINLQAAGSPNNDAIEAQALQRVFDPLPALTSLKGVIGHTLGASGAAEIALLTACIESESLPAPHYLLDESVGVTLAGSVPRDLRYILASILGFGGSHAAVVLENQRA